MVHEPLTTPAELTLPDNIHDLLDESLSPADDLIVMHGGNTDMFIVEGHPELFIRLNPGNSVDNIKTALRAAHGLREYRIDVLPAQVVEHDGEAFVVTKKVTGQPLIDLLSTDTTQELLDRVDGIWRGLARNLIDAKVKGTAAPSDVTSPEQYMVGTVADEMQPRVWLIDLPEYTHHFTDHYDYAESVLEVANGIAAIQSRIGKNMSEARLSVMEAAALAEDSPPYGDGIANATSYVIEHNVQLSLEADEDKIMGLRTK